MDQNAAKKVVMAEAIRVLEDHFFKDGRYSFAINLDEPFDTSLMQVEARRLIEQLMVLTSQVPKGDPA